ncbi:hypothetical protein TWF225_000329 [Orbilia oligospora]|nr:hypothetical protein TWF225_000329 [Orbilia oligospora]KAF3266566.1 hypothetical protein TWF128_010945 [Orbilia oligospora]KAF3272110.1 hypothetical protein TWF217_003924 [Orbilia oligospora]KAF3297721.1 hypothetical protein TWF132_006119 [Orbilia oligospora]
MRESESKHAVIDIRGRVPACKRVCTVQRTAPTRIPAPRNFHNTVHQNRRWLQALPQFFFFFIPQNSVTDSRCLSILTSPQHLSSPHSFLSSLSSQPLLENSLIESSFSRSSLQASLLLAIILYNFCSNNRSISFTGSLSICSLLKTRC